MLSRLTPLASSVGNTTSSVSGGSRCPLARSLCRRAGQRRRRRAKGLALGGAETVVGHDVAGAELHWHHRVEVKERVLRLHDDDLVEVGVVELREMRHSLTGLH